MRAMKITWEEKGYGDLALTSQNLRDQAARLEKTLGSVADSLSAGIERVERREEEGSLCEESNGNINGCEMLIRLFYRKTWICIREMEVVPREQRVPSVKRHALCWNHQIPS